MANLFVDRTTAVLNKVLDGASARQRVLANNIANVDTPGYTRQEVHFEDALKEAIDDPGTDGQLKVAAIEQVEIETATDHQTPGRDNGNNVAIDREMADMAKNSLQYETAAQLLYSKFRLLRNAIKEGR